MEYGVEVGTLSLGTNLLEALIVQGGVVWLLSLLLVFVRDFVYTDT